MTLLEQLQSYLDDLDQKRLQFFSLIAAGILALAIILLLFFFYKTMNNLKEQFNATQDKKKEATLLLERYYLVKKQQAEVDGILNKERDFKISQAFEKLLQNIGITKNKAQEPETTSQQVLDGYTEWTLYANLINLSTKKLTELLYAIEQEERIYTKEVEIEKSTDDRAINVKITIATLEPKTQASESAEQ